MTFAALFSQVTGLFEKRFLVTYFLPSFLFWALLTVVWFAGRGELESAAGLWVPQTTVGWVVRTVAFFAWVFVFSNLLASHSMNLLRLYEGYWSFPGSGPIFKLGQGWYQKKLKRLQASFETDSNAYQEVYHKYPLPTQLHFVMPTILGNILRNSELYAYNRYRIDSVLIWPRLYSLFSPSFTQTVVELRTTMDFMLVISMLATVFAFVSGSYLIVVSGSPITFLLCFGAGLLVAWLAYRGAVAGALLYGEQIKLAFDLYRNQLLTSLKIPLPSTPNEERATWETLSQWWYRGIQPDWKYTP